LGALWKHTHEKLFIDMESDPHAAEDVRQYAELGAMEYRRDEKPLP
jgi:hypothetical protein